MLENDNFVSEGRADNDSEESRGRDDHTTTGVFGVDLKVVVPAHNAQSTLGQCLDAIIAGGVPPKDILVVNDGSGDDTPEIALKRDVSIVTNRQALRPAKARNRGVEETTAEVIVFVDADVVLAPDAVKRMAAHFKDPEVTAVIGSYDDVPDPVSKVSQYRNLLHHFVHQNAPSKAHTFWTGIGAVRRRAFLQAGGFDRAWENIEDVEFGLRVIEQGGNIRLDPAIQGTHLKIWTLNSMLKTDYQGRAIPWARLIKAGRMDANVLNTSWAHKFSALAVLAVLAGLIAAPLELNMLWLALAGTLAFIVLNAQFLGLTLRMGGLKLALVTLPCHAAHYLAALAGYFVGRFGPDNRAARA